jgi:hypothetical protein
MGIYEIFASGGLIVSLFFLFLILLIPLMIYSGQKWAYKCYGELREQTKIQKEMIKAIYDQKYQLEELNLNVREVHLALKER